MVKGFNFLQGPVFFRKVELPDALLGEDAHVDLKAEQREHRQREHRQDDHIAEVLDGLDHGAHDGLEACGREGESEQPRLTPRRTSKSQGREALVKAGVGQTGTGTRGAAHTWHDGHRLEGSEHPEGPEGRQVPEVDTHGHVPAAEVTGQAGHAPPSTALVTEDVLANLYASLQLLLVPGRKLLWNTGLRWKNELTLN